MHVATSSGAHKITVASRDAFLLQMFDRNMDFFSKSWKVETNIPTKNNGACGPRNNRAPTTAVTDSWRVPDQNRNHTGRLAFSEHKHVGEADT